MTNSIGQRAGLCVGLIATLTALACLAAGPAAAKKTKTFDKSVTLNAPIQDVPAVGKSVPVRAEINVPKKYKKKIVGDVNVTFQTTGSADGAAGDLNFKLSAPNQRTVYLLSNVSSMGDLPGTNIGPLTLDDESPTAICRSLTLSCPDPDQTLIAPFAGTANLQGLGTFNTGPLRSFDGLKMRGTWTLTVWDNEDATTSTLVNWGIRIKPAKPVTE
jgi:subtilisin-like proprotein convertase family protein